MTNVIRTQAERDALEAAARAAYVSYEVANGNPRTGAEATWRERTELDWRRPYLDIAQAAITAYLSALEARGMRVMPREATDEMVCAGIAERHGEPVPEAWTLATKNVWTAMFDAADGGAK